MGNFHPGTGCQFRQSPVYYAMLFEQIFRPGTPPATPVVYLSAGSQPLPLLMVRNPRARRYLLRLRPDGAARVTIPRGGSTAVARQFVERHRVWLERELERLRVQPRQPAAWQIGTEILLRGDAVRIEAGLNGEPKIICYGGESLRVPDTAADLRPAIEDHLRKLATLELPPRVLELAARHGLTVGRITVRSQKSRWGCIQKRVEGIHNRCRIQIGRGFAGKTPPAKHQRNPFIGKTTESMISCLNFLTLMRTDLPSWQTKKSPILF